MSTIAPAPLRLTHQHQIDRLHDELARIGVEFTDEALDHAMYSGVEAVAAEDSAPYRYDFEFGDATWDRMLPFVLDYLELDYDVFAGL